LNENEVLKNFRNDYKQKIDQEKADSSRLKTENEKLNTKIFKFAKCQKETEKDMNALKEAMEILKNAS
jgi:peptidoglycan hydrolase CwlO-like protein